MAALERLRGHAGRIPRSQLYLLLSRSSRSLSSDASAKSSPDELNNPSAAAAEPSPVPPVSYAPKPKASEDGQQPPENARRDLSRSDVRFIKDAPVITPVSYAKKVAPLPEDRAVEGKEDGDAEKNGQEAEQVMREGKRIEADSNRISRRVFQVQEEKMVPFPALIKTEKKQGEKKVYELQEAIRQLKANAQRNFDETLEAHVNLGIDRRRSDLGVSGAVVLPHGTGKVVRVAVFAEGAAAEEALAAGADVVGGEELIQQIKNGAKLNFDKCIATFSMMQRVASISKILRALTPNTKKGTVTNDVTAAMKEAKQGLLDFKMKDAIVHVGLGKLSYPEEALRENVGAFVNALLLAKPAGLKKTSKYAGYVNSFHLASTMGPGFSVTIQSLSKAADNYNKLHPR